MNHLELIKSIRLVTDVCLEVAPGETVLCIGDGEENMEVLNLIAAESMVRGAEVATVLIEPRRENEMDYKGPEPPRPIARAMREADVVITMGGRALLFTEAWKEATAAGVKFATFGPVTKEYLALLDISKKDLLEVRALTEKIVKLLTEASSAHLTTRAGTDLRMSLKGRNGMAILPFGIKGSFCIIPTCAEATCAPIENSVEGVALVDGTLVGAANFVGPVEEPFEIRIEKGRIVQIGAGKDGRRLENLLNTLPKEVRNFGELGVNSNHKVPKKLMGNRTDNWIAGHVHLGFGRNDHLGGTTKIDIHLDALVTFATLLLDGIPILENGNLKI